MKLRELLDRVESIDDDQVIYAERPWTDESEATLVRASASGLAQADRPRLTYFLEIHVAREVLEVTIGRPADAAAKRRLLMFYAENDAYPSE